MPGRFAADDGGMKDGRPGIPTTEEVLDAAPEPVTIEGARQWIRDFRAASGRRIVVLDDDLTGSQSVHNVDVVTPLELKEYESHRSTVSIHHHRQGE